MRPCILLLLIVTLASVALAQSKKDKIEIGVQTTSLTIFSTDFPADDTQAGIGGRVTYNFNRSIAAEAEINFFPQKQFVLNANGSAIQAQFGVKIGKRFEKFGIFGKLRPGFLSVDKFGTFIPPQGTQGFPFDVTIERRAFFTLDAGGVLELYPSKRMVVRFEAGDTVIRHPERFIQVGGPNPVVVQVSPKRFKHNFQFTAGIGFRLGDFPEDDATPKTSSDDRLKRFEVGAQFTSLFVNSPATFSLALPRIAVEPGFGPRFTFNLTESVAFEAEGNYYTRLHASFPHGGHMFQAQFGGKVGKRFDRWGVFGKARPGFVGFTRVFDFPEPTQLPFLQTVKKLYPSLDVGGVVEFYISPRWMARFDLGDTVIRYGEIAFRGVTPPVVLQPKVTRHNLQVTSGIGFRF